MTLAPDQQRKRALKEANDIRRSRKHLKAELREGSITLAEAITRPCVSSMQVFDLLCAQWHWGPLRAHELLKRLAREGVPVGATRPVGQLTQRQREALLGAVA